MFLPNCISSSPFLILLHLYFISILLCPNFTLLSMFPSCHENSEELMMQGDEEISTTLYLSILNRYMNSHVCEMCEYRTTQEFRCTSGHRFGRTRVRGNFPELRMISGTGVVFFLQWLRSSFSACCSLGLMMWFIISKEISRNWDQAATLTLSLCRKAAGWTRRHLLSSRLFVSVFIFLCHSSPSHISLFLSVLRCQKTVKIHVGTGKAQHVQAKVGVRRCSLLQCVLVGWEWATARGVIVVALESLVELEFLLPEGWKLH